MTSIQRALAAAGLFGVALLVYLLSWPVPVDPVAWTPPAAPGFTGDFAKNDSLAGLERVPIDGLAGPEGLTVSPAGTLYTTSHEGWLLRQVGERFERWVSTGGRPLGIEWDAATDRLLVADAYRGLLAVTSSGAIETLVDAVDGEPLVYADDVSVASDGKIYFSEASTKFGAEAYGGTYEASLLDILEHGGQGRVLVFDPETKTTEVLLDGLQFANGVALGPDESALFVVETGMYRVLRVPLDGSGPPEPVLENLPGFPDNIERTEDILWVGLVSARKPIVDATAGSPFVRRILQRLPAFLRPEATRYAHVVGFDASGAVLYNLQDHAPGAFSRTTGALEAGGYLYVSSLHEPTLGRIPWPPPR